MGICVSKPSVRHDYNEDYGRNYGADTAQASSNTSSSDSEWEQSPPHSPRQPVAADIPDRAKDKISALRESYYRSQMSSNPNLLDYAKNILDNIEYRQSNIDTLQLDAQNLGSLAAAYNTSFSQLNLHCFDSRIAFLDHLQSHNEPGAWRGVFRLNPPTLHHVAVDVRNHSNGQKTLIVLEPITAYKDDVYPPAYLPGYPQLREEVNTRFRGNAKMSVIETDAQRSWHDCVIFSLNFALCAYQKDSAFDSLHEKLAESGYCFPGNEDSRSRLARGIELIDGKQVLPAVFYKHAHSRGTVTAVANAQPHIANDNVSTNRSSSRETLNERAEAFRVHREGGDPENYSMSIESSRARKIRKALEGVDK
ncbi:YopJ family type III secretion system effector XopJ, partial [Pseudomonas savastanoi]|uniref:YopJ family type III secretion system effector XopJ n=1 Tax=Pseudomonas savastanoi TaxID=29438 RepID=UPI000EFECB93